MVHHVAGHGLRGVIVGAGDAGLQLAIEQRLAQGQRHRRLVQDRCHQAPYFGVQQRGLCHPVDQTLHLGLVGRDERTRHQHFERRLAMNVARQGHARRRAKQAQVDATDREARVAGGYSKIAHRHQLATRRRGDALHPRDHRHRQRLDRQHHAAALGKQALVVGQRRLGAHLAQIVPGAERAARGGDDQHAGRGVTGNQVELGLQRIQHGLRQGIEGLRPVQRERNNAPCIGGAQQQRIVGGQHGCNLLTAQSMALLERARSRNWNF